MNEEFSKKKIFILSSIVLVSAGLIAWSLVSSFRAGSRQGFADTGEEALNFGSSETEEGSSEEYKEEPKPPTENNPATPEKQTDKTAKPAEDETTE